MRGHKNTIYLFGIKRVKHKLFSSMQIQQSKPPQLPNINSKVSKNAIKIYLNNSKIIKKKLNY